MKQHHTWERGKCHPTGGRPFDDRAYRSRVIEVYSIMADGFINQNYAETEKGFLEMEEELLAYIDTVSDLSDTAEERANAEEFGEYLTQYCNFSHYPARPRLESLSLS